MDPIDLKPILEFLKGLRKHNERPWFESHRAEYQLARSRFEDFVGILIHEIGRTERLGAITPKDCIFRLNRDLRFSKDKSPYKPYMCAYIAPGGRKSRNLGTYFHLEPGNRSMIAGGFHEPEPQQIANWRRAIDRDPRPWKKIAAEKSFRAHFGEVQGERLKTAPQGYPRDPPEIELLRLKQVTVARRLSDAEVLRPGFLRETLTTVRAMRLFLGYLAGLAES